MNKENWKVIVHNAGWIKTKSGLVHYLRERNKLPFVSNWYSVTIKHYEKMTIAELINFA